MGPQCPLGSEANIRVCQLLDRGRKRTWHQPRLELPSRTGRMDDLRPKLCLIRPVRRRTALITTAKPRFAAPPPPKRQYNQR